MTRDWRLENLDRQPGLRGIAFTRKPYRAYREGWDHDHCVACWLTLAEPGIEGDGIVHEGYATTAAYVRGVDYDWICISCFETFAALMDWRDEGAGGSAAGAAG